MVAGAGGGAGRQFVFQQLVESLQQRQSNLLKREHDLGHTVSVHVGLKQPILLVAEVPTQHCLDKERTIRMIEQMEIKQSTPVPLLFKATGLAYCENCMMEPSTSPGWWWDYI